MFAVEEHLIRDSRSWYAPCTPPLHRLSPFLAGPSAFCGSLQFTSPQHPSFPLPYWLRRCSWALCPPPHPPPFARRGGEVSSAAPIFQDKPTEELPRDTTLRLPWHRCCRPAEPSLGMINVPVGLANRHDKAQGSHPPLFRDSCRSSNAFPSPTALRSWPTNRCLGAEPALTSSYQHERLPRRPPFLIRTLDAAGRTGFSQICLQERSSTVLLSPFCSWRQRDVGTGDSTFSLFSLCHGMGLCRGGDKHLHPAVHA